MVYKRKERPLTYILECVGDELDPNSDLKNKERIAQNVWELAVNGQIIFDDGDEQRILKASVKDWKDTVQWIYGHVDGPFKVDPAKQGGLSGALADTSLEDLQAMVMQGSTLVPEVGLEAEPDDEVSEITGT